LEEERPITLNYRQESGEFSASFQAMAGPCEVLIQCDRKEEASRVAKTVAHEAWRLERKYSRYRDDNLIYQIHQNRPVAVDEETARLLNFAAAAYELSTSDFDITSGILRKLWNFSGNGEAPSRAAIKELLPFIDWKKVSWDGKTIQVPVGMQVDFGGFGKEYAVDQALALCHEMSDAPILVNFGGDLAANRKPRSRPQWQIGIQGAPANFALEEGAIATSGDANRFIMHRGKKLSHILNPRTGWPVSQAPCSVSVGMPKCLQAGLIATLAILQGKKAEGFLETQEVTHWVER